MIAKKVRNIFSVLVSVCVAAVGVLSGCGDPYVRFDDAAQILEAYEAKMDTLDFYDPDKTIEITGWLQEPCVKNLMAFLAEQYPEYTFKYRYISKNSYESIIDYELSSKTATEIVMLTPNMAKKHAKSGYLEDLSLYCNDFKDKARESFMQGGKVYAVPCTSDFQCVFYNVDILRESGQKVPVSFQSFLEISDYMSSQGIKPMSAGLKDPEKVANTALSLLSSGYFSTDTGKTFGQRLANGEASFFDEIRPYMGKWQDLCLHKVYTRSMCIMDDEAAIEEFASGKSFMYMGGLYDYNRIMEANPDIKISTVAITSDYVGRATLIGGCDCGFAVNKYSKNESLAAKVISSIADEEGQKALWMDRQGSQTYLEGVTFDNPEAFDPIRPIADKGKTLMPWTSWGDHSTEIYEIFGQELQEVVLGNQSVEKAFQKIDDRVDKIQKDY